MPLKNYTTTISANKTAAQVQQILVRNGAKAVMTEYAAGELVALSFQVDTRSGSVSIRLPVNVKATLAVFENQQLPQRFCTLDQAKRVAWRIIRDWVDAQMALLETDMVKLEEIFLPYVVTETGETVFQRLESNQFQLPQYSSVSPPE